MAAHAVKQQRLYLNNGNACAFQRFQLDHTRHGRQTSAQGPEEVVGVHRAGCDARHININTACENTQPEGAGDEQPTTHLRRRSKVLQHVIEQGEERHIIYNDTITAVYENQM